jgi:FkbH-like protein
VGKTNQFNLTTRRHSEAEIRRIANSPCGQAWAIRVEDRFGDSGVVGVALAVMESGTCVIETFLLSCRVIGRGIETALLAHVVERARLAGASTVVGEYIPTERNGLCADLYPRHGFQRTDGSTDAQRFVLDLTVGTVQTPGWIRLVTSQ